MDLSISRQPVYVNEVIYDGQAEQGVEFDYTLPDYYPDIFNILKCTLKPKISSYSLSGDKLICDGVVCISVLYLGEENGEISHVEHRYTYSKTIDLPRTCENASVTITPKTDYCTCRAVSGRRIDVRGAVSFKVKVTAGRQFDIITDAEGCGIQLKTTPVVYAGKKITAQKQYIVREDIESADTKGTVKAVVNCDAVSVVNECKVVADKVVLKGEVKLKAMYITEHDGESSFEVMEADIPVSQIIDADGMTEKHTCYARFRVLSCDLSVKQTDEGGSRIFGCEIIIESSVTANCEETIYPVTDVYSTDFESSYTVTQLKAEVDPTYISHQHTLKETISFEDVQIESVADCRCELTGVTVRIKSAEELTICGQAIYQCIARPEGAAPVYTEKTSPFEITVQASGLNEQSSIDPNLQVMSVGYSMDSKGSIEVRSVVSAEGCLCQNKVIDIIKEIEIDKASPKHKQSDYTLKLYFSSDDEDVWSIAKRYNTSVDAIVAENGIRAGEKSEGMLLIPLV